MTLGALIGLLLISLFLLGTGEPNPEWGRAWWIKPLLLVPFAGAMGGMFTYFVSQQNLQSDWAKIVGMMISLLVFIVGLWMGFVLGLNGTYWN